MGTARSARVLSTLRTIRTHTSLLSFSCQLRQLRLPHHEQVALELIKAGADVEKPDNEGFTPLMSSCQNGHEQVAAKTDFMYTSTPRASICMRYVFHVCLLHLPHHEQVARELLKAGADRNKEITGYSGWNALKLAERNGHVTVCDLLRDWGVP